MPQKEQNILPQFLNLDSALEKINIDETIFSKGVDKSINANTGVDIGMGNPSGEGQNSSSLTPSRSNVAIPNVLLPEGYNKTIGVGESEVTQENYIFNYNENGNHGIYVLNGNDGIWSTVIIDQKLKFSNDPKYYIAPHRVILRLVYDETGAIIEKYLAWTDGQVWQGFISVNAAIQTNGFDVSLYPYWALQPPHFDREELFQWATRPVMYNPTFTKIPNTDADLGTINQVLDKAFQFCIQTINTDGRVTTISPFSLPAITKSTDFLNNPDLIPKKYLLSIYGGSPLTEKIILYYRMTVTGKGQTDSDLTTWTDWFMYDTLYKYSSCGDNSKNIIGTQYWLRKDPWSAFSYDPIFNTIKYVFDNSKVGQLVDQSIFDREETALPQLSVALNNAGDSALLGNNRYDYDNLPCSVTDKLNTTVEEFVDPNNCNTVLRKMRLYVYIGRSRGNQSNSDHNIQDAINVWMSEVGYYNGDDKQMRFGGMYLQNTGFDFSTQKVGVDIDESKYFELDFADRNSFRCYLKGTPYNADATWYQVSSDLKLTPIAGLLDATNQSDLTFITNVYNGGGFFVGVFDFEVPAGKYIATLGRHNVANNLNYKDASTYIIGIANSRLASESIFFDFLAPLPRAIHTTSVKLNAIVTNSKEIEVDCTSGDLDVWGNGADLFYVCCPFIGVSTNASNAWSFVEGYLYEDKNDIIPIELFSYNSSNIIIPPFTSANGVYTDKNGFFWAYAVGLTDVDNLNQNNNINILFRNKIDCIYPTDFTVINNKPGEAALKPNNIAYFNDLNPIDTGQVGVKNRVIYKGKITDLTGLLGYSNVGISIKDGGTTYTDSNGEFTLIIHNGFLQNRTSNVYVNAGGDFLIFGLNCGQVPLLYYDENLIPCGTLIGTDPCTGATVTPTRYYPVCQRLSINIPSGEVESLKQGAPYTTGAVLADKAGRLTYVNKISDNTVSSFLQRDNTNPTHFRWNLSGALQLNQSIPTKDLAWICFVVSIPNRRYVQWVGDGVKYIDLSGNVTSDPSNASFVEITIDSLLNANIQNNFTLLSTYQFVKNDRLRIYDDGNGNLFDTATYGSPIDVEIQGTNYNQAAVNANIIIPPVNTVLPNNQTVGTNPTTLFVKYDSRFDKLKTDTGFWIELYTPLQNNDKLPFRETKWYPIINGEIAIYLDGGISNPQYNYLTTDTIDYWDTYLLKKVISIPNVGTKFIGHPFESPNVTDSWGSNLSSGGRPNAINPNAIQQWLKDNTIRSEDFVNNGIINGLGNWKEENKKNFKGFNRGSIVAIICSYSVILFVCENDWFVTDYNYNYIYANAQGVQIANLDNNLGEPHQKIGNMFGCSLENTQTVMQIDKYVWWKDIKNEGWVLCNYSSAKDVTEILDKEGNNIGTKSYTIAKDKFITGWNSTHDLSSIFDIICGIDEERNNIYCTYRPRRKNTTDLNSFISNRRNLDLRYQETFVYNLDSGRWMPLANFCPESYSKIMGNANGSQMLAFASGKPYSHNIGKTFLNYFGIQTEPVIIGVFNKFPDTVKVVPSLALDIIPNCMYCDLVYDNELNSFSFIPLNYFTKKDNVWYAPMLNDMVSYPPIEPELLFQSMLLDGKKIFGRYIVVRLVGDQNKLNEYFQLSNIFYSMVQRGSNKK